MTKALFLFSLGILLIFQSCQKEVTDNNIIPTPVLIDSNYIDKIYEVEFTNGLPDTVELWSYTYDNLKRVTSMTIKSPDPNDLSGFKYLYTYNSADTLPSKTVYIESAFIGADTTTRFHFYDNSGKNLKDSSIYTGSGLNYYFVREYSYAANKIFGSQYSSLSGNSWFIQKDTATTDIDGNIIDSKKYYFNTSTSNWELTSTTGYTYDNKRSPFALLSNIKTFRVFPSGETFYHELPTYNNKVSQTETNGIETGSPNTNTYNFTNSYSIANGKLTQVKILDVSTPGITDSSKLMFTYRAL